jgi:uncharacterized membrane protein
VEQHSSNRVPVNAAWLGGLGAVPFIGLALLAVVTDIDDARALQALAAYGAVILSFLGGIHWGLALARTPAAPSTNALILSVVPSLVGWCALLMERRSGLILLALTVIAVYFVDAALTRRGQAPAWYPRLRLPLSFIVSSCLLGASLLG